MPGIFKQEVSFKRLNFFFIGSIVLLLVNSIFLYSVFQKTQENQEWVRHSDMVLSELDLLLSSMKDAESGVRGYLLTGKDTYLEPYREGSAEVWDHFSQVKKLTADNPIQQASADELQKAIRARLDISEKNLILYNQDKKAWQARGVSIEGKLMMDDLRRQVMQMREYENTLFNSRAAKAEQTAHYGYLSLILSAIFNIALAVTAFYLIRRSYMQKALEAMAKSQEAWEQTKLADLSKLVSGDHEAVKMSKEMLDFLVGIFNIPAANLYLREKSYLKRIASYARGTKAETGEDFEKIPFDQGLLGETSRKKEITVVENIPADYLWIGSSLGKSQPKVLLFVPILFLEQPVAILELALFEKLSPLQLDLIQHMREVMGVGINAAVSREKLQRLLEQTQMQSEELQAQQEELRASNEELEEQARILEGQQEALNTRNDQLEATQREVQEKAADLEKTNQYKSDFLAKMSHELRTPLNSLLILATLLKENKEGNLNEQQKHFASTIHDAGNDLLSLINDILDLSRIDARKLALRPEAFSLGTLFKQLRAFFTPQADKKKLIFKSDIDEKLSELVMHTDMQRVEQVLRNFLSNAVKFTEKGQVTLTAELSPKPGYVRFSVIDTGIGISEDKRDLIFEAFEQADSSISRKFGGTGLGLAISKELTQLLGGQVFLTTVEGEGSSFTLEIPIKLPYMNSAGATSARTAIETEIAFSKAKPMSDQVTKILQEIRPGDKNILIIEDDEAFRRLLAEAAQGYGFKTIEVDNGELALEILNRHVPTAILLDIKLPGLSGVGLLEIIKSMPNLRHVPVHVITGLAYEQALLRMGAMGYLGKPVTLDQVREALQHIEEVVLKKAKRVIVVEDDQRQSDAIAELIGGRDVEIVQAHTGESALKLVGSTELDCIVLDLSLPDMTGGEFLEKLNKMDRAYPPVIIYTGKELSRNEEEYLRKYSESIILKGARSPERLLDEVNLFLHRVEGDLSQPQQRMIASLRDKDHFFEGRYVLLVDDDLRNVFALTSVLENRGFQVVIARDGIEALEKMKDQEKIDIVLMDLMMPRMDGYEAMRRIRSGQKNSDVPIVALTAKAMRGDHEKALEAGANDYLAKPINLENLFSIMKVWLRGKDKIV